MKLNKKEFDSLTREPDVLQQIEDKKVKIFFMDEQETEIYSLNGRFAIWSSDGVDYKLLIDREYYNYGDIKDFYSEAVNKTWLDYVGRISKMQRKLLLTLMLPIMLAYVVIAVISMIFLPDYAVYILIGLMALIFLVNFFQNKIVKKHMDDENDKTQDEIQNILGLELYDKIGSDQIQFRESKLSSFEDASFEEEHSEIEETTEELDSVDIIEEVEVEEIEEGEVDDA